MKELIQAFGRSVGFDLSKRIAYLDRIVFVSRRDLQKMLPSQNTRAFFRQNDNFKIYVPIDDEHGVNRDWSSVAHSLNHEFIHCVSYQEVHLYGQDKSFKTVKSGMRRLDRFFLLNEALCELTNLYIINRFWPNLVSTKSLWVSAISEISIPEGVSFLNGLIEKLSDEMKLGYDDILTLAHTDLLVGSDQFLDLCRRKISEAMVDELSETRPSDKYDAKYLLGLAGKYRLVSLEERLKQDIINGTEVDLTMLRKIGHV